MRLMKHLLVAALIGLTVAGCTGGGDATQGQSKTSTPETKPFKVALLTPGPVSDAGWSAMAYQGLEAIGRDMGAEVANQEARDTQIKDAMRSYAQQGYQLVFGHGFEYNEPGVEVAKDFPGTVFVSSSGGKFGPNSGAFRFYLEQGCYLAGYLAGKLTKTGTVGSVAVQNYPSIVSTLKAFEAGAKAANPKVKVLAPVYFGTEGDVAAAKRATEQVIGQGADFVIHQANAAANGVFNAAKEKGVYAFGTNADQNGDKSGVVIASAVIVAEPAFLGLAKDVQAGKYKGEVRLQGMEEGAIDFVLNPALAAKVPEATQKEIETLKEDIKAGKVTVPKDQF
jgi:basic membrane lipoprotein Med (substrate-binding protein (PBP1-ABC) superfamily)